MRGGGEAARSSRSAHHPQPIILRDAYFATVAELQLAEIYTAIGESDAAIEQLGPALAVPSPVSAGGLNVDPAWARLRGNPRFEWRWRGSRLFGSAGQSPTADAQVVRRRDHMEFTRFGGR